MSVPRELELFEGAQGIRLRQKPVRELKKLRSARLHFGDGTIAAANEWLKRGGLRGDDSAELVVEFKTAPAGVEGLRLFKGETEETAIGIDRDQGRVYVDRTRSGNTRFHPKFSAIHFAPLESRTGAVKLHLFLDACSVETFVNDGEAVLSELVFPGPAGRGLEFFGRDDRVHLSGLDIWHLKSSWKVD